MHLHYDMLKYGHHRLMFFNKSMRAREWNVMVCIFLDQGEPPSGGVALMNCCDQVGIGVSLWVLA